MSSHFSVENVNLLLKCSSDLVKRTEEEVNSRGDEGDHEPETQFSLDSLDIIKVSHHVSRILYGWTLKRYHITYPLT